MAGLRATRPTVPIGALVSPWGRAGNCWFHSACQLLWVVEPSCPAWSWTDKPAALARGALFVVVLWRFADGRIVSLELVMALREAAPSVLSNCPSRGVGRSVRCWCQAPPGRPHLVRHRRAYCIVKLSPLGGAGRSVCSRRRLSGTRPRCGPGGYIQVGMRGCILLPTLASLRWKIEIFCCYPGSLPRGGEAPLCLAP